MKKKIGKYGWIPDLPDHRDHKFLAEVEKIVLPSSVDLRGGCPPVYDQGQLGSCTANAIAGAHEFDQMKQKISPIFVPSRLFIYYNERVMEHSVSSDSGAAIRDGIKSINKQGVCEETMWPYIISKFKNKPTVKAYTEALKFVSVSYQSVQQNLLQMKGCLAGGYPFVFGFSVYESFESDVVTNTGIVPMPKPNEAQLGGHAVLAVGYDDSVQRFIVRNSLGASWGLSGYFEIPYAYLTSANLASDFWVVQIIK